MLSVCQLFCQSRHSVSTLTLERIYSCRPSVVGMGRGRLIFIIFIFYTGQTAVELSGAEAADWAQCAAPD